jgi:hypothetical protein
MINLSSGRRFYGVVDLVQSTYVIGLLLEALVDSRI